MVMAHPVSEYLVKYGFQPYLPLVIPEPLD
jgi:hypothetical protein